MRTGTIPTASALGQPLPPHRLELLTEPSSSWAAGGVRRIDRTSAHLLPTSSPTKLGIQHIPQRSRNLSLASDTLNSVTFSHFYICACQPVIVWFFPTGVFPMGTQWATGAQNYVFHVFFWPPARFFPCCNSHSNLIQTSSLQTAVLSAGSIALLASSLRPFLFFILEGSLGGALTGCPNRPVLLRRGWTPRRPESMPSSPLKGQYQVMRAASALACSNWKEA